MPDLPTRLDLFAIGRDYLRGRANKINPAEIDIMGSDANLFVGSASMMAYSVINHLAYRVSMLLLDSATAEWLDRYAWDRYQLTRKAASSSRGFVRLYREVAGAEGTVPVGTRVQSLTGVDFVTTAAANFGVSDLEVANVPVRSLQAGKDQDMAAKMLRRLPDASTLFDTSLQVTNDLATAHGEYREKDVEFRNRIRGYWPTVRRGTLGAIQYGATQVDGVSSAVATEVLTPDGAPARIVSLCVADSSGVASSAIVSDVVAALEEYRAAGIAVQVYTSMPQIVPIQYRLKFSAGVATAELTQRIVYSTVAMVNSLAANAPLYPGDLQSVLSMFRADGLLPDDETIVEPTGTVVPALGKTIRTTLDNVKVL